MSSNRVKCLVVSPSPDRMMIVGGVKTSGPLLFQDSVEIVGGCGAGLFSPALDIVEECIVV